MPKSNTTMAKMGFSLLRNIARSASIKGTFSPSLMSKHNIKMLGLSMLSKQ
jgi:hypothetical protein